MMALMSNGRIMKHLDDEHCDECERYAWLLIPIIYQKEKHKICKTCFKRRVLV